MSGSWLPVAAPPDPHASATAPARRQRRVVRRAGETVRSHVTGPEDANFMAFPLCDAGQLVPSGWTGHTGQVGLDAR